TLSASAGSLGSGTSIAFDVIPGTATHLAFTQQPSTTGAGAVISPAVQVTALDPAGNPVPSFTGDVTVALGNNSGGGTPGRARSVGWATSRRDPGAPSRSCWGTIRAAPYSAAPSPWRR